VPAVEVESEKPAEVIATATTVEPATTDAPAEIVAAPAEPEMIEVWRPGRIEHRERRPHGRHRRDKGQGKPGEQPAAAPASAGDGVPSEALAEAAAASPEAQPPAQSEDRQQRGPRPPRHGRSDRQGRPQHHDRPRHGKPGGGGPRHEQRHEQRADQRPRPERREKQADPNSPFAKLAALKAQLEADAKERR
jgi:ATP-dependent RNA helicase SUPV3L1/SUV3